MVKSQQMVCYKRTCGMAGQVSAVVAEFCSSSYALPCKTP
jgi:hypothetical protein